MPTLLLVNNGMELIDYWTCEYLAFKVRGPQLHIFATLDIVRDFVAVDWSFGYSSSFFFEGSKSLPTPTIAVIHFFLLIYRNSLDTLDTSLSFFYCYI